MGPTGHPACLRSWLALLGHVPPTELVRRPCARAPRYVSPQRQGPSLTIVLPAYNEAERIGPALDELFGWLRRGGSARASGRSSDDIGAWDVLVVDDGSEDDTVAIIEEITPVSLPEGVVGTNIFIGAHTLAPLKVPLQVNIAEYPELNALLI